MRLWHYKLIPVLPKQMLVSQWRECIAIKRQWEKDTLKHRLVKYVKDYEKTYFGNYVLTLVLEMNKRKIRYQEDFLDEIAEFCDYNNHCPHFSYLEHNDRYLKQCYYNLQEKYDRGIITDKEWKPIEELFEKEVS